MYTGFYGTCSPYQSLLRKTFNSPLSSFIFLKKDKPPETIAKIFLNIDDDF